MQTHTGTRGRKKYESFWGGFADNENSKCKINYGK